MTVVDLYIPHLGGWARMAAPTAEHPYWHDAEDGTRHDLATVLTATNAGALERIYEAHIASVSTLLRHAASLHPVHHFETRRSCAVAASRLSTELAGRRPARPRAATR